MFTQADYLYEAERRRNEMVQAEQHRLRMQVTQGTSSYAPRSRPVFVHLGRLLIAGGQALLAFGSKDAGTRTLILPGASEHPA